MRVCQFRHDRVPFEESVFIELILPAFKGSVWIIGDLLRRLRNLTTDHRPLPPQYRGTLGSISVDHSSIPPVMFWACEKPCSRSHRTTRKLRPP
jgi:hypothetical protein